MKRARFIIAFCLPALALPGLFANEETLLPYGWEIEGSFEAIVSSDIQLTHATAGLSDGETASQFTFRAVHDRMRVEYEPIDFDLNGESTELDETTVALQGVVRQDLGQGLTVVLTGNVYDGFLDYRSLWLSEYYRQQFAGLGDIPGYDTWEEPDPHGYSFSGGLRWEYLPASGFLQMTIGYARDEIAPGYEIDFEGLFAGPRLLNSSSISLATENVLTPRIRSFALVRVAETTDREPRWSAVGSLHAALSPTWRIRGRLGGAIEDPEFSAFYGSITLETDLSDNWSVFTFGRAYRDTGEIENALLFSAAAPGLKTWAVGIGVRATSRWVDWRLVWSPYRTDYEETGLGTVFFSNLYKDRSWNILELSGVFHF